MTDRRTDPSLLDLNRGTLVAAAALCAVGSILGLMGLALAAGPCRAGRRWYRRADMPAHQLARLKLEQVKAAVGASGGAWRVAEQEKYSPRVPRGVDVLTRRSRRRCHTPPVWATQYAYLVRSAFPTRRRRRP